MAGVSLGFTEAGTVPLSTHLCALYSGPAERDATLFPYIEEGLRAGDDCLCLIDGLEVGSVLDRLLARVDAEGVKRLELCVERATDAYLEAGEFSADEMEAFLEENVAAIAGDPSRRLRATGEMSWVLRNPPGADEFFAYESAVNRVAGGGPSIFLCLYDLDQFGADMMLDVLRTHPQVVLDGAVRDNPHYQSPETYAPTWNATAGDRRKPGTSAPPAAFERRVAALVAGGASSREVVERLLQEAPGPEVTEG